MISMEQLSLLSFWGLVCICNGETEKHASTAVAGVSNYRLHGNVQVEPELGLYCDIVYTLDDKAVSAFFLAFGTI